MTIALFVESPNKDTLGLEQTLIVPNINANKVDVYHRLSTGSRGRADAWKSVPDSFALPSTELVFKPVAIRLTANDEVAIQYGKITPIAIKAITAHNDSMNPVSDTDETNHALVVFGLVDALERGDDTNLAIYLVDKRMINKTISLTPISASMQEVVEPTPVVTTNQTITVKEPMLVGSAPVMNLASVPDIKWSQEYLHRKVGGLLDFDVYDTAMNNDQNVLIKGHAGSGKTMSVMAYASARGHRYYNVSNHIGVEPSQLFGKYNPTCDGHFAWQDGAVTDLVRNGGVLLLNEVNFMPERVSTVIFSLLDDRREIQLMDKDGEVIKAHKDLLIIADMNPAYRGTRELNEAFSDRFAHQLYFPYDADIEKELIPNKAIRDMAGQLRDRFEQDEITTPISTRSLVAFQKNITNLGIDYAIYSYINTFPMLEQAPIQLVVDTYKANIEQLVKG